MPPRKIEKILEAKSALPAVKREELTESEEEEEEEQEQSVVPESTPEPPAPKQTKAKKSKPIPIPVPQEPEEEEEEEEEDEGDEEEVIEYKKPKKIKNPSELRKYQNDKIVIKDNVQNVSNILRTFKMEIMKLFKVWKNEELTDDDVEDIILSHNDLKQAVLDKLYDIEQALSERKIKLPKSMYDKIDNSFESAKERINILVSD